MHHSVILGFDVASYRTEDARTGANEKKEEKEIEKEKEERPKETKSKCDQPGSDRQK